MFRGEARRQSARQRPAPRSMAWVKDRFLPVAARAALIRREPALASPPCGCNDAAMATSWAASSYRLRRPLSATATTRATVVLATASRSAFAWPRGGHLVEQLEQRRHGQLRQTIERSDAVVERRRKIVQLECDVVRANQNRRARVQTPENTASTPKTPACSALDHPSGAARAIMSATDDHSPRRNITSLPDAADREARVERLDSWTARREPGGFQTSELPPTSSRPA